MNAGVLDLLSMLRRRLETSEPFLVVSGYRSPTTNHRMYLRGAGVASNSYHIHGMAIDLRAEGPGSVAGSRRGAQPALRRGRLLSALRLCPRRLRAGAHLVKGSAEGGARAVLR